MFLSATLSAVITLRRKTPAQTGSGHRRLIKPPQHRRSCPRDWRKSQHAPALEGDSGFQQAYLQARRDAVSHAYVRLQQTSAAAGFDGEIVGRPDYQSIRARTGGAEHPGVRHPISSSQLAHRFWANDAYSYKDLGKARRKSLCGELGPIHAPLGNKVPSGTKPRRADAPRDHDGRHGSGFRIRLCSSHAGIMSQAFEPSSGRMGRRLNAAAKSEYPPRIASTALSGSYGV